MKLNAFYFLWTTVVLCLEISIVYRSYGKIKCLNFNRGSSIIFIRDNTSTLDRILIQVKFSKYGFAENIFETHKKGQTLILRLARTEQTFILTFLNSYKKYVYVLSTGVWVPSDLWLSTVIFWYMIIAHNARNIHSAKKKTRYQSIVKNNNSKFITWVQNIYLMLLKRT